LEERCKALERILDETTRKNQALENKVYFIVVILNEISIEYDFTR